MKNQILEAERQVAKTVSSIIASLDKKGEKLFLDPDFGPNVEDPRGAFAMYRDGKQPSPAYPHPDKTKWLRPTYAKKVVIPHAASELLKSRSNDVEEEPNYFDAGDDEEEEVETWCEEGVLFKDGVSSGDVIQGKLGDCWFLGAIATLATRNELLESVFWCADQFSQWGIFVCRFMKDFTWHYVIVDDRLPVFDNPKGLPLFARCRDVDELWVLIIEKAYAKLHGSYDALVGGYIDYGLRDCTGLASHQIILQSGFKGYHPSTGRELSGPLWDRLIKLHASGSLMGCSIQPDPNTSKDGNKGGVEADAGNGLKQRHAYSIIDLKEIEGIDPKDKKKTKQKFKLVRIRNPWGFGEWTGAWSDSSDERELNDEAISKAFSVSSVKGTLGITQMYKLSFDDPSDNTTQLMVNKPLNAETVECVDINGADGTFFMLYEDWSKVYTHLFLGIDFPDAYEGMRMKGEWTKDTAGGNNMKKTWLLNPRYTLTITKRTEMYILLTQSDGRLMYGKDHANYMNPIGFHIVENNTDKKYASESEREADLMPRDTIPNSVPSYEQIGYNFHHSVSAYLTLDVGKYFIVPSTYTKGATGFFFLTVYGVQGCFE